MSIYLPGLAIGGYRSFGSKIQRMGPFEKINIFVGANNSGKSNILRFLHSHIKQFSLPPQVEDNGRAFDWSLDGFVGESINLTVGIGYPHGHTRFESIRNKMQHHEKPVFENLFKCELLSQNSRCVWFDAMVDRKQGRVIHKDLAADTKVIEFLSDSQWCILARSLLPENRNSDIPRMRSSVLDFLNAWKIKLPKIYLIPAVRHIGDETWGIGDVTGPSMRRRLAELQVPKRERQDERMLFDNINQFIRKVLDNSTAEIKIPSTMDEFNVHMDGKLLPLDSLGTGIHEVITFAVVATLVRDSIICFEEPELHLHPILQRKLLSFLHEKTSNQYFITTHSAHLIDAVDSAACFRVQLREGQTIVERAESAGHRWEICQDLGYRASDLMQANCIIWVEGPTDRLYVRHWLAAEDPKLTEGIHYSIMFYGGRLLCHLSPDDCDVNDFIALCRLNRNIAIVMDSDKAKKLGKINETKMRISEEIKEYGGYVWVTEGREIENYIPPEVLQECVNELKPGLGMAVSDGKYDHALPLVTSKSCKGDKYVDKLAVAHNVIRKPADLERYDLKKKIRELVKFIRDANA